MQRDAISGLHPILYTLLIIIGLAVLTGPPLYVLFWPVGP